MGFKLSREIAYGMLNAIRSILEKDSARTHIARIKSEMKRSTEIGGKEHGRREEATFHGLEHPLTFLTPLKSNLWTKEVGERRHDRGEILAKTLVVSYHS